MFTLSTIFCMLMTYFIRIPFVHFSRSMFCRYYLTTACQGPLPSNFFCGEVEANKIHSGQKNSFQMGAGAFGSHWIFFAVFCFTLYANCCHVSEKFPWKMQFFKPFFHWPKNSNFVWQKAKISINHSAFSQAILIISSLFLRLMHFNPFCLFTVKCHEVSRAD